MRGEIKISVATIKDANRINEEAESKIMTSIGLDTSENATVVRIRGMKVGSGRVLVNKKDTETVNMRGHGVLTIARTMIGSGNFTIVSLDRVV